MTQTLDNLRMAGVLDVTVSGACAGAADPAEARADRDTERRDRRSGRQSGSGSNGAAGGAEPINDGKGVETMDMMEQQELEAQGAIMRRRAMARRRLFSRRGPGQGRGRPKRKGGLPAEQEEQHEEKRDSCAARREAYFAKHPGYQGGQVPKAFGRVAEGWDKGLGEVAEYEPWKEPRGDQKASSGRIRCCGRTRRRRCAAGSGLGGGGDTKQKPEDPFLMGFNDEKW